MKNYFLFPAEGKPVRFSEGYGKLIRIDMEGVTYFEEEKLVKDLRDLANYVEKYGRSHSTRLSKSTPKS